MSKKPTPEKQRGAGDNQLTADQAAARAIKNKLVELQDLYNHIGKARRDYQEAVAWLAELPEFEGFSIGTIKRVIRERAILGRLRELDEAARARAAARAAEYDKLADKIGHQFKLV